MSAAESLARAKINLSLEIRGRRSDGYHLLDSLVAFASIADRLSIAPAERASFKVTGPFAGELGGEPPERNLVLRALRAVEAAIGEALPPLAIHLDKQLPIASGLGGGSADAAAMLRLLDETLGLGLADRLAGIALGLGADVPMCVGSRPARVRGIGEIIEPVTDFPHCGIVLANPRRPVPTGPVFAQLGLAPGAAFGEDPPPLTQPLDYAGLVGWLRARRNDLEPPAIVIEPAIAPVLAALAAGGADRVVRMSGSGGTCFALLPDAASAADLAADLADRLPGAWIASGTLG